MMKIILFFASLFASGQAIQIDRVTADPPGGTCNVRANFRWNTVNDKVWACDGASWKLVSVAGVTIGTVSSVGFSTNLGTVTGSPVTTSGTITDTVSAAQIVSLFSTCSGVQYLGADGACHSVSSGITNIATTSPITGGPITTTGTIACATCVTSAASLTANLPVFGSGGQATAVGTRSGNTTEVMSATGSFTSGNCLRSDANGNSVDAGVSCSGGGGGGGGGIGSNIVTANWSTLGSPTRTDNTSSITILTGTSATNRIEGVSRSVSAGDFSITITLYAALPVGASGPPAVLIGFTDGAKTEGVGLDASSTPFLLGQNLSCTALSAGTTAAANGPIAASLHPTGSGIVLAKITRVGTDLSGYLSYDGGITYTQIFNDVTPFLTASAIAVYVQTRGSTAVETFTLLSSSLP